MVECKVTLGVNAQVLHEDFQPVLGDHICEDMIHKRLECRWSVAKAKEHNGKFKESERSDECSLPLVFFADADVVESPSDIELSKYRGVFHVVD